MSTYSEVLLVLKVIVKSPTIVIYLPCEYLDKAARITATPKSTSSLVIHIGGLIRIT